MIEGPENFMGAETKDNSHEYDAKKIVEERLEQLGVSQNEILGQHFLIDTEAANTLTGSVGEGSEVLEIGPGVGQITERIAEKAGTNGHVTAIEIDKRYEPVLSDIEKRHPNVKVVYGDAIGARLEDYVPEAQEGHRVQVVANLPYHITEPFMHKLTGLPIEHATLMVGDRFASATQAKDTDPNFGQLSLLAQTYFDVEVLKEVDKSKFVPEPRTHSAIIRLTPKSPEEMMSDKRSYLLRRLFETAKKSPLVKNSLKEGIIAFESGKQRGTKSKEEYHRSSRSSLKADLRRATAEYNGRGTFSESNRGTRKLSGKGELTQNEARAMIEETGIPEDILNKPFQQLNNTDLVVLSRALRKL